MITSYKIFEGKYLIPIELSHDYTNEKYAESLGFTIENDCLETDKEVEMQILSGSILIYDERYNKLAEVAFANENDRKIPIKLGKSFEKCRIDIMCTISNEDLINLPDSVKHIKFAQNDVSIWKFKDVGRLQFDAISGTIQFHDGIVSNLWIRGCRGVKLDVNNKKVKELIIRESNDVESKNDYDTVVYANYFETEETNKLVKATKLYEFKTLRISRIKNDSVRIAIDIIIKLHKKKLFFEGFTDLRNHDEDFLSFGINGEALQFFNDFCDEKLDEINIEIFKKITGLIDHDDFEYIYSKLSADDKKKLATHNVSSKFDLLKFRKS